MNKIIIAAVFSLTLSGCLWQTVDKYDLDSAYKVCRSQNSDVFSIRERFDTRTTVKCMNGYTEDIK